MELHKYFFIVGLVALTLIVAACTTEVEVVKEVEVTREGPVAAAPVSSEPRELNLLVGSGRAPKLYCSSSPKT